MNRREDSTPRFNSIRDLHQKMVTELSNTIFPCSEGSETQHKWKCFTERLLFTKVEKEGLKDMFDVFNALLEKDEIDYGKYSSVKRIFTDLDLIACRKIIETYEDAMEKIERAGAKSDVDHSRPGQTDAISLMRNERMKKIHMEMVCDLDRKIKETSSGQEERDFFRQFTKILQSLASIRICEINMENIFEIFQLLVDNDIISYGNYDIVNNVFTRMRKYELLQIVTECEEKLAVPHNLKVVDINKHSVSLHFIPGLQNKCVFDEWIAEAEEINNPHWKEVYRVRELVSPIKIQNLLAFVHYRLRLKAENGFGPVLASEPSSVFQTLRELKRRHEDEEGLIHAKVSLAEEQSTQTNREYIYTSLMENYNKCFQKILELPPDQLLPSIGKLTDEYERIFKMVRRFEQDGIRIGNVSKGCLQIAFYYRSLDALRRLWDMYSSGKLRDVLQEGLITKQVLDKCQLKHITLNVSISEEEYQNCLRREELQKDTPEYFDTVKDFKSLEIDEELQKDTPEYLDTVKDFESLEIVEDNSFNKKEEEQTGLGYKEQGRCIDENGAVAVDIKRKERDIQGVDDKDIERVDKGLESNKKKHIQSDSLEDKQGVKTEARASNPRTTITKTVRNLEWGNFSKVLCVVSIDIGTTYSGCAFSFRNDFLRDPWDISSLMWVGSHLMRYKTSTAILLTPDKKFHSFGYEAESHFAELADNFEHQKWYFFRGFKMILFHNEGINRNTELKDFTGKPLPAILVFSMAIRCLKEAATESFTGRRIYLDQEEVKWVLTVPSICSDAAKQFMREAAEKAGIDNGTIALDGECAAIYCKNLSIEKLPGGEVLSCFKPGGKYLTLDCGGGTLDCTIHEVGANGQKELLAASGGDLGGDKVNAAFEQMFDETILQQLCQKYPSDYLDLCSEFERKKRVFNRSTKNVIVRMPTVIHELFDEMWKNVQDAFSPPDDIFNRSVCGNKLKLRAGKMCIPLDVFENLFREVVSGIVDHVRDLMVQHNDVDTIIMAGGFSNSLILRDEIKNQFPSMKIIEPEDPDLAVMKGAIFWGHCTDTVASRIMKYTYGISNNQIFRQDVHPLEKKIEIENQIYCRDVFDVLVRMGETVPIGHSTTHIYVPCSAEQERMVIPVYASDEERPLYVTDSSCRSLGIISLHMTDVTGGKNRNVIISLTFGSNEFKVEAIDENTGVKVYAFFDFLSIDF